MTDEATDTARRLRRLRGFARGLAEQISDFISEVEDLDLDLLPKDEFPHLVDAYRVLDQFQFNPVVNSALGILPEK